MNQLDLSEDFRCLDLAPPVSLLQVEHAYRRKVALYAEDSLATYNLFEQDGREAQLARLGEAYLRIRSAHAGDTGRRLPPSAGAGAETRGTAATEIDPAASPGRFLRECRMQAGLNLKEIAARTKISPMKLTQIEEERFELLPAPVYLRGFIRAYAHTLGLGDPEGIAQLFLACQQERRGSGDIP